MNWLPRFYHINVSGLTLDEQHETRGHAFAMEWLGFQVEISFGRTVR